MSIWQKADTVEIETKKRLNRLEESKTVCERDKMNNTKIHLLTSLSLLLNYFIFLMMAQFFRCQRLEKNTFTINKSNLLLRSNFITECCS